MVDAIERGIIEIDIKEDQYCVYAHYVDLELIYIGMGRLHRAFVHQGGGRTEAWKAATKNGYRVSIVALFENRDRATSMEKSLIKNLQPRCNLIYTKKYSPKKNKGRTGIPHSEESIRKMAERAKKSWERQKALGLSHRRIHEKIQCIESGEIFESMTDASRKTGISLTGICQCVNGKSLSAKGKTFIRMNS